MQNLLDIAKLTIAFDKHKVVDDLSFSIHAGEIFCLVGESGSGKSMTALSILKLLPENAQFSAETLKFNDQDILNINEKLMCKIRGRDISMIFQEPMTSLNPVLQVGNQVMEAYRIHNSTTKHLAESKCKELFNSVGLSIERINDYPHQLSGGMRQRVMIAMALACSPKLLLADEPTTALDVTIQEQILALLKNLVKERNMGLLFITHDLRIVSEMADTVAVMYAGELMELAPVKDFFEKPLHPYSKALMDCMPDMHTTAQLYSIAGSVPPPAINRDTCAFWDRCKDATEACKYHRRLHNPQNKRYVRCYLYEHARDNT